MKALRAFAFVLTPLIVAVPAGLNAQVQDYPTRPITLISPWPAGGASDTHARLLASKLADRLGKRVVVENRPGAGAVIGMTAAARAPPDGYTLVRAPGTALVAAPTIYKKLPYDPRKDFAPIAVVAQTPFVLVVHPSLPVRSVAELVSLAKERPGQFAYASGGPGSPHHLYTELLKSMTSIEMMHVPYKGTAPAVADVVAGHVRILFSDIVAALPLIREGKLRALGVSMKTRLAAAPEIPTIAEGGVPGFDVLGWAMVLAPTKTPKEIVGRLHAELQGILDLRETQQQMSKLGYLPVRSPPLEELQPFINSEIVRWAKIVHQAGIAGSQ
jgi:tripartite-type tricarboxylate transporter receptor subunit TctC